MEISVTPEVLESVLGSEPLLDVKKEQFCKNVAAGFTHADAYQSAVDGSTRQNATNIASRWMRTNELVKQRVSFLNSDQPLVKLKVINLREKRDILAGMIEDESASVKERIAAMRLDAQLAGEFAPTQHHQLSLTASTTAEIGSAEFQKRLAAAGMINQKRQKDRTLIEQRTDTA